MTTGGLATWYTAVGNVLVAVALGLLVATLYEGWARWRSGSS